MTMTVHCLVQIKCDGPNCKCVCSGEGETSPRARAKAKAVATLRHWEHRFGNQWLCQKCADKIDPHSIYRHGEARV